MASVTKREIAAADAQGGKQDDQPADHRHCHRDGNRDFDRHTEALGQDRCRVGADTDQERMPETDIAGAPRKRVPTDREDREEVGERSACAEVPRETSSGSRNMMTINAAQSAKWCQRSPIA